MNKVHFTLTQSFNVGLIIASGLVASALLLLSDPRPVVSVALGVVAGLVAGTLQRRSVRLSPSGFARAKSAFEVRRAFTSNRPGKLSIMVLWLTGAALLALALIQTPNPIGGVLAGYAGFMFTREIVTLGAVVEVRRNVQDS